MNKERYYIEKISKFDRHSQTCYCIMDRTTGRAIPDPRKELGSLVVTDKKVLKEFLPRLINEDCEYSELAQYLPKLMRTRDYFSNNTILDK